MTTQSKRGFSLIEVLVVVSIIALLIAILLPALSRSRRGAEDTQCMSNMSQLMKAQLTYAVEHDSFFPHYQEWIWGRDRLPDGTQFRQYAVDYTTKEAPLEGLLNTYITDMEAHFCPVAPEMPVNGLKHGYTPLGDKVVRSYVQNGYVYPGGYTLESVSKPAELLMLTEENTFSMNFQGMAGFRQHFGPHPMNDGQLNPVWDSIGSMHRRNDQDNLRSGFASGAFLDGSVDWVYSQAMGSPNNNATISFIRDDLPNPEGQEKRFIADSPDYSYTY
ncbi:MAG: type II secretion system protein [Phycisphaeraceae bacterium]